MIRLLRHLKPKHGMIAISGHGHHKPDPEAAPKSFIGRHYHWVIAGTLFLTYLIYCGLVNNQYSLFMVPVTTDLEISRGTFSLASTFSGISGFLSSLFYIEVYRRFRHKVPAIIGFIVYAAACVGYSFAKGVWAFYIYGFIAGFFSSIVGTIGSAQIVNNWFRRYHGTVLGVILAASGVGGAVFAQIDEAVMEASSWRTAMLVHGGTILFAGLLTLVLLKNRPEQMGLHPLGYEDAAQPAKKGRSRHVEEWGGESFKGGVAKKPAFWILVVAFFLCTLCCSTLFNIVPAHIRDQGMSSEVSSQVHSVMLITLALAKIIVGFFCDRFSAHKVVFFLMASNIAAAIMLATVRTPAMALVAVSIYSFGLSFSTMMPSLLASDLFGTNSYARSVGILVSAISLGGMTLTPFCNFLYDRLGSYTPIMYGIAGIAVLITILFAIVSILAERDKKKYLEEHAELTEMLDSDDDLEV
ncbi:MAG: MFS transporter [Lachnospiraceae bacterium]|nr:MFS transporter [Lachnospiraceae bacterium]